MNNMNNTTTQHDIEPLAYTTKVNHQIGEDGLPFIISIDFMPLDDLNDAHPRNVFTLHYPRKRGIGSGRTPGYIETGTFNTGDPRAMLGRALAMVEASKMLATLNYNTDFSV